LSRAASLEAFKRWCLRSGREGWADLPEQGLASRSGGGDQGPAGAPERESRRAGALGAGGQGGGGPVDRIGPRQYRQLVRSPPGGTLLWIRSRIFPTKNWWYRRRDTAFGRVWSPFQQCSARGS